MSFEFITQAKYEFKGVYKDILMLLENNAIPPA